MRRFYANDNGAVKRFWAMNKNQAKCLCLIFFNKPLPVSELKFL